MPTRRELQRRAALPARRVAFCSRASGLSHSVGRVFSKTSFTNQVAAGFGSQPVVC